MRALIVFTTTDENSEINQELFRFSEALHQLYISNIAVLPSRFGRADEVTHFARRKVPSLLLRGLVGGWVVALLAVLQRVQFIVCSDAALIETLRRLTKCPIIDVSDVRYGTNLEERVSALAVVVNQAVVWQLPTTG